MDKTSMTLRVSLIEAEKRWKVFVDEKEVGEIVEFAGRYYAAAGSIANPFLDLWGAIANLCAASQGEPQSNGSQTPPVSSYAAKASNAILLMGKADPRMLLKGQEALVLGIKPPKPRAAR